MSEEKRYTIDEAHRQFAVMLNHEVWDLFGKDARSKEEEERMVYAVYASAYHWLHAGTPLHHQRAEWLISHVLAALGRAEPALFHAQRCDQLTQQHPELMHDFDKAYSLEALARAQALNGSRDEAVRSFTLAREAGKSIQNEEDRSIFEQDLHGGNWFGIDPSLDS